MKRETKEGLKIFIGTNEFEALIIESDRLDRCIQYVLDGHASNIILNSFMGFTGKSIDFLQNLAPVLKGITILEPYFETSIINSLNQLEYIGLADNGKDILDLSNFPNLKTLAVDFGPRLKKLESCNNLESLTLSKFKCKTDDLEALPPLHKLEELTLLISPISSLKGIGRCVSIKKLKLYSLTKLISIEDLSGLAKTLESLEILSCKKIGDYESLRKVKSLKTIKLGDSGVIKSLRFLEELPNLEFFSFVGTNVLDGDLSYCKGIGYVGFDEKRHYNLKMKDFKKN
jgi:hypothetical protein